MKLKKLISDLPVKVYRGARDIEITGLRAHSKQVAPGHLFIAKKGTVDDGTKYVEEAIANGAVAILSSQPNPFLKTVTQLIHPDVRLIEAELASKFFDYPSRSLFIVGITGTNGKTTITFWSQHLLNGLGIPCGMIGTIEYRIGSYCFEAELTTPDVITNQKLLKEMKKQNLLAAVIEVSSHGLTQGRVTNIDFDTAIFSNLTPDHGDYHESMEAYACEKAKLFSMLSEKQIAIVNYDSAWTEKILINCPAKRLSYGFSQKADLVAYDIQLYSDRTAFLASYQGESVRFHLNVIGRFNILNALAAMAVSLVRGVSITKLPSLVATFPPVPGRLEKIDNLAGLSIFVDYAHTPDALKRVLMCLKEIFQERIITVFGCGGDREHQKRSQMGKIAGDYSYLTFITSDNPRTEEPGAICQEIASGFTSSNYLVEVNRRLAIVGAIEMATKKDVVLIAGKGHETYQLIGHQTLPFDDRKVAREIANSL